MRRVFIGFMCAVFLLSSCGIVTVHAGQIMPLYEITARVSTSLNYSQNTATCGVVIFAPEGTKQITGSIELYDDTTENTVKTWDVDCEKLTYHFIDTIKVKSGHTYTLTFTGTVYDSSGVGEPVNGTTTKKN